jgi:hypothetical protein
LKESLGYILPNKVSVSEYYFTPLAGPFRWLRRKLKNLWLNFLQNVLNYWWCGHCQKYHSGRTIAYDFWDGLTDLVCSIGAYEVTAGTNKKHKYAVYVGGELREVRNADVTD